MRLWLRFLPCMPVALSILADAAQAQTSGGEVTTIRSSTTTTLFLTRTQRITIQITASAAPGGTMDGGEKYLLQGCYGQPGLSDVGTILGANYTTRNATAGTGGLSLSMCLEFCGSSANSNQQPYPYVGVSDGKECYCGTSLGSTAKRAHPEDCGVPCEGNTTVACGGHSFMLIYKLAAPAKTPQNKTDTSTSSGIDSGNSGRKSSPGITAAVIMGSICGFGALLLVLLLGARRWRRRKQLRADRGHQLEPSMRGETKNMQGLNTETHPPLERASTGIATRVDPRRLDGIVMDGQLSPIDRPSPDRPDDGPSSRRQSYLSRTRGIMSATTGAEWRTASPATPRGGGGTGMGTPKSVSTVPEDASWDDIPHTPSILVQHPDSVAQNHGLGERAWNRRRLSAPFPPAGYTWEDTSTEEEIGRRASSSQGSGVSARLTDLRSVESLIPPPLDLPRFGRDIDDSLALSDDDGALLSPRGPTWTKWSLPSSSPVAGSFVGDAKTGEKAGKTE